MAKKALNKDIREEIRKTKGRFISILMIVALGTAFFSGLRSAEYDMRYTADYFYDEYNLMDFRIESAAGLTAEDEEAVKALENVEKTELSYSRDVVTTREDTDYVIQLVQEPSEINKIHVTQGSMPEKEDECLLDNRLKRIGYEIGDVVSFPEDSENIKVKQFKITGFGDTPMYAGLERGSSTEGNGQVAGLAFVKKEVFDMPGYTQLYVTAKGAAEKTAYTDGYDEAADRLEEELEAFKQEDEQRNQAWYISERSQLPGYKDFGDNAERMGAIGKVFPAIFFLVAALVALTAITRMVEEQRTLIGTYKALGYSTADIARKYIMYALLATLAGSIVGVLAGEKIFPVVIIMAYRIMYSSLTPLIVPYNIFYGVFSALLAVVSVTAAAFLACFKELRSQPAQLMRPEAPKPGKRVLLERITFIWKKLSFSQKNTFRNLFRYKKRFIMTIFGIGCCTGLLIVGFGLKDSIMRIADIQYDNVQLYDAMAAFAPGLPSVAVENIEKTITEETDIEAADRVMMKSMDCSSGEAVRTAYIQAVDDAQQLDQLIVLRDYRTKERYTLDDSGVIITKQLSDALGVSEGDFITVKAGEDTPVQVRVAHVAENYLMHYVYMTSAYYEEIFGEEASYNMYLLKFTENGIKNEDDIGQKLMQCPGMLTVNYVSSTRETIDRMLDSLYIIVIVLVISASLLAFIVIYNLNNINISERRRELATIKLLGFYDGETAWYIYRENIYLTIFGAAVGLLIGYFLHGYVINTIEVNQVMFSRVVTVESYIFSILLTFVFSAAVNIVMYFQIKKIDMIESLKSVE